MEEGSQQICFRRINRAEDEHISYWHDANAPTGDGLADPVVQTSSSMDADDGGPVSP